MASNSPDARTEGYQKIRDEALALEAQHLKIRVGLRDIEAALRSDPGNEELKTRLEDLKKSLASLDQQAPWLNSDAPPPYLRETTSRQL